jgi:hypothetical protein
LAFYKTRASVFFLPAHSLLPGSTPGSTIGASSLLINPGAGSPGVQARKRLQRPAPEPVDMNCVKKTRIMEKLTFQFRAEFCNIFSHAKLQPVSHSEHQITPASAR